MNIIKNTTDQYKKQLSHIVIDEIAIRLLDKLEFMTVKHNKILLDGFWFKSHYQMLQKHNPSFCITLCLPDKKLLESLEIPFDLTEIEIVTDSDLLHQTPIKNYDLILSNLYLQHLPSESDYFLRLKKLLSPDGCFYFSSIGPVSIFPETSTITRPENWTDMHDLGDKLRALNFNHPVIDAERLNFSYQTFEAFCADCASLCPLLAVDQLPNAILEALFKTLKVSDKTLLPLEIVYGHSWQSQSDKQKTLGNETYIDISMLRKQK